MSREQASGDWMTQAACLDYDPEIWFPVEAHNTDDAVAICSTCPVRAECLELALETGQAFGVWGGLTERQRVARRRKARAS